MRQWSIESKNCPQFLALQLGVGPIGARPNSSTLCLPANAPITQLDRDASSYNLLQQPTLLVSNLNHRRSLTAASLSSPVAPLQLQTTIHVSAAYDRGHKDVTSLIGHSLNIVAFPAFPIQLAFVQVRGRNPLSRGSIPTRVLESLLLAPPSNSKHGIHCWRTRISDSFTVPECMLHQHISCLSQTSTQPLNTRCLM